MSEGLPMRDAFALPEGVIYLDGNSLGPLSHAARERVARTARDEWGAMLIGGWNGAGWIDLPARIGARIARLIGAAPGTVTVCDSTSVNLFKLLSAALALRPERSLILTKKGNFPTDLYVAEGLIGALGERYQIALVEAEEIEAALNDTVAVLMLSEVDYRTGRRLDMERLTRCAQAHGVLTIWDLAHSAGALPVDLAASGADFAVGCGYKYLNGGPGAPAFLYTRQDHIPHVSPALCGWMGHAAAFDFDPHYRPAEGIERFLIGTPPVLSMASLDAALTLWDHVDITDVRARSIALSEQFIAEVERQAPDGLLVLASPRDPEARGSQVSFRCAEGYAVMQALIAEGVIGDFRAPDLIRFGFAPLYNTMDEVTEAAGRLAAILREGLWDRPEFKVRAKVT